MNFEEDTMTASRTGNLHRICADCLSLSLRRKGRWANVSINIFVQIRSGVCFIVFRRCDASSLSVKAGGRPTGEAHRGVRCTAANKGPQWSAQFHCAELNTESE